jgi:hypothetical protein
MKTDRIGESGNKRDHRDSPIRGEIEERLKFIENPMTGDLRLVKTDTDM